MKTAIGSHIEESVCSWTKEESKLKYSEDDLIDAFLRGKEAQANQTEQILLEKLVSNLTLAKDAGISLFGKLKETGIDCKKAFLRINSIAEFEILTVLAKENYENDTVSGAYKTARLLKKEVNNNSFRMWFSFMSESDHLNTERIISDGYYFKYGKHQES